MVNIRRKVDYLWVESAFLLGSLRVSYIVTLSLEISNLVDAKVNSKKNFYW